MSKYSKAKPKQTLVEAVLPVAQSIIQMHTKKTDDELLAECVRINDKVQAIYKLCPIDTPVLWAEVNCPKLAADYWRKTEALDELLAARDYTPEQVATRELPMLDALRAIVKAVLVGRPQPLTEDEAFAVEEKAAIVLEGMVTKNEQLARIRALQALL